MSALADDSGEEDAPVAGDKEAEEESVGEESGSDDESSSSSSSNETASVGPLSDNEAKDESIEQIDVSSGSEPEDESDEPTKGGKRGPKKSASAPAAKRKARAPAKKGYVAPSTPSLTASEGNTRASLKASCRTPPYGCASLFLAF